MKAVSDARRGRAALGMAAGDANAETTLSIKGAEGRVQRGRLEMLRSLGLELSGMRSAVAGRETGAFLADRGEPGAPVLLLRHRAVVLAVATATRGKIC